MADSSLTPAALRHRRELTIANLCEHFARDHLEMEELEELIDGAHKAVTVAELDALLTGLPALDEAPEQAEQLAPARPGSQHEHQVVLALMSGAERKGQWTPARNVYVTAMMGGVELDFSEARLSPGVTEVYVLAIMGGVQITVAPDTCVESNGVGIMGGFDHSGARHSPATASTPVLRVSGLALMGGVEIKESSPDKISRLQRARDKRLRRGDNDSGND